MDYQKVVTGSNKLVLNSLVKPIDTSNTSKDEIRRYFENSYDLYESLFSSLRDEKVFYYCPDRLRLPLIFYFGHTSAVYINKLLLAALIKERVDLNIETMLETGVDEMSWDDTENYRMGGSYKWPSLNDVVEYRRKVRNVVYKVIEDTPLELPITEDSPWWAVLVGIEHERVHFETSTVLIRLLPIDMVGKPEGWMYAPSTAPVEGPSQDKNSMIKVAETTVIMGKPRNAPSYGWDNEYPEWERRVPAFEASQHLVTNGEFLEFVKDGGYQRQELWSQEGWQWRTSVNARHPFFWVCSRGCKSNCGGALSSHSHCQLNSSDEADINPEQKKTMDYKYRAMFSLMDLPMEWPVEVNYHVAKAYCTWQGPGYRLITECEHLALRDPQKSSDAATSDDVAFQDFSNPTCNANCVYGSSSPVKMFPPNKKGFYDVYGNAWEWTEDHFNGFPGFKTNIYYDDWSSSYFDGRHNVVLGSAWATTGMTASRHYRNWFRRHFYQHCGFRLVRSVADTATVPASSVSSEIFILGVGIADNSSADAINVPVDWKKPSINGQHEHEAEDHLNSTLLLEYGVETDNYAVVIANQIKEILAEKDVKTEKALHIGSSGGRLTFELAAAFNQVIGLDYCARYIDACQQLKASGCLPYSKPESELEPKKRRVSNGESQCCVALVPEHIDRDRAIFKQMTWIPNELIGFDAVFLDMLHRVMNKEAWITRLWEIVEPGGLVFILMHDGLTQDNVVKYSRNRLEFVEEHQTRYINGEGESKKNMLTVWKRSV